MNEPTRTYRGVPVPQRLDHRDQMQCPYCKWQAGVDAAFEFLGTPFKGPYKIMVEDSNGNRYPASDLLKDPMESKERGLEVETPVGLDPDLVGIVNRHIDEVSELVRDAIGRVVQGGPQPGDLVAVTIPGRVGKSFARADRTGWYAGKNLVDAGNATVEVIERSGERSS